MSIEIRVIIRDGKKHRQYKRVCADCGDEAWKAYFSKEDTVQRCSLCAIKKMRQNFSKVSDEELPQDEEKNRAMIDEFLKKKKGKK